MTKGTKQNDIETAIVSVISRDDINPDKLEKFLDLQERILNKRNEQEFSEAMAGFQQDCPIIERKKKVSFKSTKYDYATLDEMVYTIKPILAKHGLSFSFDTVYGEKDFQLITIISHINGHSKKYSLTFPRTHDDQRMNETQRMKSALTYAKRAGLENALGIVTSDEDDDARRLSESIISPEQAKQLTDMIEKTQSSLPKLLEVFGVDELAQLNNEQYRKAKSILLAKMAGKK